jgi:biotin synthase
MLSRVVWPVFEVMKVAASITMSSLKGEIRRICIQALNYPSVLDDILALIASIRLHGAKVPISVSCQPLNKVEMAKLRKASVEKMGIALDAATAEVFDKVKGKRADGPYEWQNQRQALVEAVDVFGIGNVSTHLIVGLGEREQDIIEIIQWCTDTGVYPAIFAFTPILGTKLEHRHPPTINQYRRIQLAHYLIVQRKTRKEKMVFTEDGRIVDFGVSQEEYEKSIRSAKPFLTSGCPSCNRPYYNEKPSGPLYNYPFQPNTAEVKKIRKQLEVGK